jgi:hypothetical protein
MPMIFPTSPTVGQVFINGGRSWVWSGSTWDSPSTENKGVLAVGGTTGQMLTKSSNANYDTQWTSRPNSATNTIFPSLILSNSWTTHITVTMTCSGRPVFVKWNASYINANSGAMRTVGFRAQLDGVTIGLSASSINIPNNENDLKSEGILVTPTAGSRTFTFQGICGTASACILNSASLIVYEI